MFSRGVRGQQLRSLSDHNMSHFLTDNDLNALSSVVNHVFMPPKLPQEAPSEQVEQDSNVALCCLLIHSAKHFFQYLPLSQRLMWMHIVNMLKLAWRVAEGPFAVDDLQDVLSKLSTKGVLSRLYVGPGLLNPPPIRCFCYAYPGTECCCYRAQSCRCCSIRNVRGHSASRPRDVHQRETPVFLSRPSS